jgi:hypothetical protein
MEEINIRESFLKKLDENYQTYLSKWLTLDAVALIENAEKIAVIKQTYQQIKDEHGSFYNECMAYLMQFENPLEVISDDLGMLPIVDRDDVGHALWQLSDQRDADCDYELDMTVTRPARDDDEMEV